MKRLALMLLLAGLLVGAPAQASPTLLHWWKGDGNVNDSVGTNNGSLIGDTTFTTGVSGQAFSFDGAGDYASVPDDPSHYFSGSFTVDLFVKSSDTTGEREVFALYECASSCPTGNAASAIVIALIDGQVDGEVRDADAGGPDSDGGQNVYSGASIADGSFHHLVLFRDNEAGKVGLYVDGTEVAEENLDPGAAGATANLDGEADPMTLGGVIEGGTGTPKDFLTGAIDEVKLYAGAAYPDTTPPSVAPAVTGPVGGGGWYVGNVNAGWTVSDESVIRSSTGCDPLPVTSDTAGMTLTCQATSAGGTGSGSVTIRRDATGPTVKCSPSNPGFAVGATGKAVSATVSDALSGPAAASVSATPDTSSPGSKSVKLSASDVAGNSTTVSCPYTVLAPVTTITSLHQCLHIGPFRYRFKVPLKKLQGGKKVNRRSRVRVVRFKLDGRADGSDSRRPFVANIKTARLAEGRHVLSADVLLQIPRTGARFHRRQSFSFSTCA
jgi:concanavalin A-like lectin/glucanase superfamily protein